MRYTRVFHILTLAVILSLLCMAIQSAPVFAAVKIELDPSSGEVGKHLYVEGENFQPTQQVGCGQCATIVSEVNIYFSPDKAYEGDEIDDEVTTYECLKSNVYVDTNGYFKTKVWVPHELTGGDRDEDVRRGNYWIYVTYTSSNEIEAVASFTVVASEIELSLANGAVGTQIEISGAYFANSADITVLYDEDVYIESIDHTNSHGDFDCSIIIPQSVAGGHTISVEDESGHRAEATFTVEPSVTLSTTSGPIAEITASGTGFSKNKDITITFGDERVDIIGGDEDTNANGSFEAILEVPNLGPRTYDVEVEDDDGNTAVAEFNVTTSLNITPLYTEINPGHVGAQVTISGFGFEANSQIIITYTSDPVEFTTTSLGDGSFSYILTIPSSGVGPHTISATDGIHTMEATFYMESTSPATPQPQLPQGSKLEDWKFNWGDVIDDSAPVTYELQIATEEQFTEASMLLEKTELATSEYTLTDEEELESTSEEEPYYWRVRAIDSASNASGWTGATAFFVDSSFFELKGWLLYTLIGIGAFVIFFLGFWIGRRTILEYY